MNTKSKDWWIDFFPAFRPLFGIIPGELLIAKSAYIIRKLGLKPGNEFPRLPLWYWTDFHSAG